MIEVGTVHKAFQFPLPYAGFSIIKAESTSDRKKLKNAGFQFGLWPISEKKFQKGWVRINVSAIYLSHADSL